MLLAQSERVALCADPNALELIYERPMGGRHNSAMLSASGLWCGVSGQRPGVQDSIKIQPLLILAAVARGYIILGVR